VNELTKKYGLNVINCAAAVKDAQRAGLYVNVMRPSKWGNPFVIGRDGTRSEVIEKYRTHVLSSPELVAALPELKGKYLGCVCLPMPCHVEVLIDLANNGVVSEGSVAVLSSAKTLNDFREAVGGKCKCGKKYSVGYAGPLDEPVALHELPYCREFEKYELVEYLRWLRGAMEN
jgi:hypothetical protein